MNGKFCDKKKHCGTSHFIVQNWDVGVPSTDSPSSSGELEGQGIVLFLGLREVPCDHLCGTNTTNEHEFACGRDDGDDSIPRKKRGKKAEFPNYWGNHAFLRTWTSRTEKSPNIWKQNVLDPAN